MRLTLGLIALALSVFVLSAPAAFGQTTTGSLSGIVTDQDGSTALPGAAITAVHTPTGTRYNSVTGNDGRYRILNVRVGGPYTVTATMAGFQTTEATEIFVRLGSNTPVNFDLPLSEISETVTVVAEASPLINPNRTGSTSAVSEELIESLPNINRDLVSLARTNPFVAATNDNDEASSLTIAGRNNRYNNIQIDGAVNNDLFGLADSGTPGGQAETQPVSLDAIEELQLLVAPYGRSPGRILGRRCQRDHQVRYQQLERHGLLLRPRRRPDRRSWTTASTTTCRSATSPTPNTVCRSVARSPATRPFFFFNYDVAERERPTGFSLDGSSGVQVAGIDEAMQIRQFNHRHLRLRSGWLR